MRLWLGAITIASMVWTGCALVIPLDDLHGADAAASDASTDAVLDASADAGDADAAVPPDAADGGGLGPLASWTFDEDGGTTAHDVSGHGHDGVISGGTWIAGHSGSALLLNGTNQFVAVPASKDFDKKAGGSFSMTAWIQRVGTFSHELVFSISYGPNAAAYALEAQSNTLMNYWDGVSHVGTSPAPFVASEWHHAAVVIDTGTVARSYFDGVQVGGGPADDTPRTCTAVMLGASNFGDYLPGAIDNVRFYARALTTAEVVADMTQ